MTRNNLSKCHETAQELENLLFEGTARFHGSSRIIIRPQNFPTGVSDCHNMIGTLININIPKLEKQKIQYRSFRTLDVHALNNDLQNIDLLNNEDDSENTSIDNIYENFESDIVSIFDKHAPIKYAYVREKQLPYMNRKLRKAIYDKKRLHNRYLKCKNSKTWESYRKSRNLVNKLKKQSINTYFQERCIGGCKSANFWSTIKPYLSKRSNQGQSKIILTEENKAISDDSEVAETFNTYFVNVAEDIGKDYTFNPQNHPSLTKIEELNLQKDAFEFKLTDENTVSKIIDKFNPKKATGADKISVKLLKLGKPSLVKPLTNLINISINANSFPSKLKQAQVTPLHKKNDPMLKSNYRPVSILPIPSKIYEKVLSEQLTSYFDSIFDDFLCAFRKGHGCQTTLLRLLEDWKFALDSNEYVAAILMDLSKAFDCLPHDILLSKLSAYGLSDNSVLLLKSYLSDRKQRIKIGSVVSSWANINKGVPQGSILGPLLFNVFINDIFYFIKTCTLYNYADDNTLSFHSPDFSELIKFLQQEGKILIDWFSFNCMQANPGKFQAIAVGKKTFEKSPVFRFESVNITCEEVVKLLGVDIDFNLSFDQHISNICKKAAQQLNVMRRIGHNLSLLNRLTIFHTFVLSNFNFCPLAWHFCTESNTKKMEKLQERGLRFVYNDFFTSYEDLLTKAKLSTLHIRRMRTMAIETFKILNNLAPPVLTNILQKRENRYNFRYSNILQIPSVRTSKFGKNSFRYAAPVLWNSLPEEFRKSSNFNQFRQMILSWNGKECKCVACNYT